MLKMIEAFSKAKENCDVGFAVKASNLGQSVSVADPLEPGLESSWSPLP